MMLNLHKKPAFHENFCLSSKMFVRMLGLAAGILLLCMEYPGLAQTAPGTDATLLPSLYVIGTRRPVRSTTDTTSPVDVISGEDFSDQGTGDVSNLLRTLVPSYNVGTQPISDAATFIRPANLRGLASDQTLVFVNGKRRHRAAVITFLGNGISQGAQGADISVIPSIAIKRVEVLRDSASAQYGSDAIAGVVNFVLKDSPDSGTLEAQWGQTYEGDGEEYRTAVNIGVPVTESGFANLSAEWREARPTIRSVQRDDAAKLIAAGNTHVREPYAQIWGAPDVADDIKVFLNSAVEISDRSELYAFANLSRRETEGGFFFRNPTSREGVNVIKRDRDGDGEPESEEELVYTDPRTGEKFRWADIFPGGFTPQFKGKVKDMAGTIGYRGTLGPKLTYDVSYTIGRSRADFSIRDTINASLGAESPTQFELGSYTQTDQTFNTDITYAFDIPAFSSPLFAAAGFEWRNEEFHVREGQEESWIIGPLAEDGFGVGANGFSGFSDQVAGIWDRSNIAFYVDLEADILKNLTVGTMGRIENFDDFGSTADVKVSALFKALPQLGLRGSFSTGFRVPTVGQENIQNITTAFLNGELRQNATLPATCPEAQHFGAEPLEPEESLTFTVGLVGEAGLVSFTADYFNIEVNDRLGKSGEKTLYERVQNPCIEAADVVLFTYFGNGFDTRTQGVDIVTAFDLSQFAAFPGGGKTELVFVGNWTETEVISYDPEFLDEKRILQLEDALPKYRFNATLSHLRESWSGFLRLNYFGSYTETHVDQLSLLIHAGAEVTLDAEISYLIKKQVELSIGAENLFNNFPDVNPHAGVVGSKYPESSPMGFAGGFYYGRLRYLF